MRLILLLAFVLPGVVVASASNEKPDVRDAFFTNATIPHIRITLDASAISSLKQDSHRYIKAIITEGGTIYRDVGLHLKGGRSFQQLDGKPSFTVNFDKFVRDQNFHGLDKLYLNNSIQDPSYMCEYLGSYLFRGAGVPAARVTHARVALNGRDLGLYVLVEGYDRSFLKRHFKNPDGNFYDSGYFNDITDPLEITTGQGSEDRSDLRALVEAAREPDPSRRLNHLALTLDLDRFYSYLSVEVLASSSDGYALNKNNYRLYHDPERARFTFIPSGMDQLFMQPGSPLLPDCAGMVAGVLLYVPHGRDQYLQRCASLLTNVLTQERLTDLIDSAQQRLRPAMETIDPALAAQHRAAMTNLHERIAKRLRHLSDAVGPSTPLAFAADGTALLTQWHPHTAIGNSDLNKTTNGPTALMINCAGGHSPTVASWRARALLPPGRYQFQGRFRADGVTPIRGARGVTLRVFGRNSSAAQTSLQEGWQQGHCEFSVDDQREEEFICEVRAYKGRVAFAIDSLTVKRL